MLNHLILIFKHAYTIGCLRHNYMCVRFTTTQTNEQWYLTRKCMIFGWFCCFSLFVQGKIDFVHKWTGNVWVKFVSEKLTAYFWFSHGCRIIRYVAISRTLYIISVTWCTVKVISTFFSLFLLRFNHWNSLGPRCRCCQPKKLYSFLNSNKIHWFWNALPFPWFSFLGVCTELLLVAGDWLWPTNGNAFDSAITFGLFWFDSCIIGVAADDFVSSDGVGVRDRCADAVGVVPLLPVFDCSVALLTESLLWSGCCTDCCVADGVISPKPELFKTQNNKHRHIQMAKSNRNEKHIPDAAIDSNDEREDRDDGSGEPWRLFGACFCMGGGESDNCCASRGDSGNCCESSSIEPAPCAWLWWYFKPFGCLYFLLQSKIQTCKLWIQKFSTAPFPFAFPFAINNY